ncbi:hypothetical protein AAY473_002265 [Plecturocebus cupreus]
MMSPYVTQAGLELWTQAILLLQPLKGSAQIGVSSWDLSSSVPLLPGAIRVNVLTIIHLRCSEWRRQ